MEYSESSLRVAKARCELLGRSLEALLEPVPQAFLNELSPSARFCLEQLAVLELFRSIGEVRELFTWLSEEDGTSKKPPQG